MTAPVLSVVDSTEFEQAFAMKATPLRDAIRETVIWYRVHPPLADD